jgi:hypothetical protein
MEDSVAKMPRTSSAARENIPSWETWFKRFWKREISLIRLLQFMGKRVFFVRPRLAS